MIDSSNILVDHVPVKLIIGFFICVMVIYNAGFSYVNLNLPSLCYFENLGILGIVDYVYWNFKIRNLEVACAVPLVTGLLVNQNHLDWWGTTSVMEFFLSNHPLDCPICDQGGGVIYKIYLLYMGSSGTLHEDIKRAVVGFSVVL